jgi:sortase B
MGKFLHVLKIVLLCAAALCLLGIGFLAFERGRSESVVSSLRSRRAQEAVPAQTAPAETSSAASGAQTAPAGGSAAQETPTESAATQTAAAEPAAGAFPAALKQENADLAAWLTVPGTSIDYPVMQTPSEPEYYLRRDFRKQYSFPGTPFFDANCDPGDASQSLFVYGHNLRDGAMFSDLEKYQDESFFQKNPVLLLSLPGGVRTYRICAVLRLRADDRGDAALYGCVGALTEAEFSGFAAQLEARSLYSTQVRPKFGDGLLTLSTCSYFDKYGRLLVVGCCADPEAGQSATSGR